MLNILIIRKMKIKSTKRYHLTSVRIVIVHKSTNNNGGKNVEKREHLCTVAGNADGCSCCGKQHGDSSRNYK